MCGVLHVELWLQPASMEGGRCWKFLLFMSAERDPRLICGVCAAAQTNGGVVVGSTDFKLEDHGFLGSYIWKLLHHEGRKWQDTYWREQVAVG